MTQTYPPAAPVTSATFSSLRPALLAVWALLAVGALAFVAFMGTNAPYADEWEFVPALLGHEPQLSWLWAQHNEHRMPLPRAIVLTLFTLTHDFRAGSVLQVAMLAALALYLMRLADQLRGRPHWADLFFPVSLLHIGHWENFIMGYQICFVLFCVLVTGLAVVALRVTRESAFRSGLIAGGLLTLLALTGGSGLVVVPPVSAWLAVVALTVWQRGERGRAAILLLLALLPLAYLGVYFHNYHKPEHHPPACTDPLAVGGVAGEVLAMAFGVGVSPVWWAVCAGMLTLGGATVVLLVRRWKQPGERLSVLGLLAVAAGVTGVALAIGVGRGSWGSGMGLWSRYAMLTWPLLGMTYLVWVNAKRKWVPIALCMAAALAFPGNTGTGMVVGAQVKGEYSAIAADAAAGRTAEQIANSPIFKQSYQGAQVDRAERAIPLLRAAGVGIFAK